MFRSQLFLQSIYLSFLLFAFITCNFEDIIKLANSQKNGYRKPQKNIHFNLIKRCLPDFNVVEYYYLINQLTIDVSKEKPIVSEFDILVFTSLSKNGDSFDIKKSAVPIHYVHIDIESSKELINVINLDNQSNTNLKTSPERNFKFKSNFKKFSHKLEPVQFTYDSDLKIIKNIRPGVVGYSVNHSSKMETLNEKAFLRISFSSEYSEEYKNFYNSNNSKIKSKLVQSESIEIKNILKSKSNVSELTKNVSRFLSDQEFDLLSEIDQDIYESINGEIVFFRGKFENILNENWNLYSFNKKMKKYNKKLFFEFKNKNKNDRLPVLFENRIDPSKISFFYLLAHLSKNDKIKCEYQNHYPYYNWTKLPNDKSVDPILDDLMSKKEDVFKNISLHQLFGFTVVPSIDLFNLSEPIFSPEEKELINQVGIYDSKNILDRFHDVVKYDYEFSTNNEIFLKWMPIRKLTKGSNVLKLVEVEFNDGNFLMLNESVDENGWVLYEFDKDEPPSQNEYLYLKRRYEHIFFENDQEMIKFAKVKGFISKDIINKIYEIYNFYEMSEKSIIYITNYFRTKLQSDFGKEEYLSFIDKYIQENNITESNVHNYQNEINTDEISQILF